MTDITDVPDSEVYLQEGAIVMLVAQILDINTGLPVQLQVATGLSLTVLYPDRLTSQTFAAQLYTDGSDGRIVYITRNDGSTIDLSQVGLYQFQGNAVIGGVALPPSFKSDFYVLPNMSGNPTPPAIFSSSSLILFDSNGIRWGVTVNPSGALVRALTPSGPTNFLMFNGLVMKDAGGLYWTVSISITGVIQTTPGGSFTHALTSFILTDTNNRSWVITISEAGVLTPA